MVKKILIAVLIVFVAIQFVRPARNNGNAAGPSDITQVVTVPDSVMAVLKTSCYDCHSNHTEYPWYTNVNPVGMWLHHHVDEGKGELNFSEFAGYSKKKADHKLDEVIEQIEKKEMPLSSYTIMHGDAKLSAHQAEMLINWAKGARQQIGYVK